jgi:hypothetical protein
MVMTPFKTLERELEKAPAGPPAPSPHTWAGFMYVVGMPESLMTKVTKGTRDYTPPAKQAHGATGSEPTAMAAEADGSDVHAIGVVATETDVTLTRERGGEESEKIVAALPFDRFAMPGVVDVVVEGVLPADESECELMPQQLVKLFHEVEEVAATRKEEKSKADNFAAAGAIEEHAMTTEVNERERNLDEIDIEREMGLIDEASTLEAHFQWSCCPSVVTWYIYISGQKPTIIYGTAISMIRSHEEKGQEERKDKAKEEDREKEKTEEEMQRELAKEQEQDKENDKDEEEDETNGHDNDQEQLVHNLHAYTQWSARPSVVTWNISCQDWREPFHNVDDDDIMSQFLQLDTLTPIYTPAPLQMREEVVVAANVTEEVNIRSHVECDTIDHEAASNGEDICKSSRATNDLKMSVSDVDEISEGVWPKFCCVTEDEKSSGTENTVPGPSGLFDTISIPTLPPLRIGGNVEIPLAIPLPQIPPEDVEYLSSALRLSQGDECHCVAHESASVKDKNIDVRKQLRSDSSDQHALAGVDASLAFLSSMSRIRDYGDDDDKRKRRGTPS